MLVAKLRPNGAKIPFSVDEASWLSVGHHLVLVHVAIHGGIPAVLVGRGE